jgi:high-affinity iron transporter
MLANFLIGLREGLEASLIVGILIAFAVRSNRRPVIPVIWGGVAAAIALSAATGAFLLFGLGEAGEEFEPILSGALSVLAAGLITWMVFWMAKTARNLKSSLEGNLENSFGRNSFAVALVAFFAVAREGVETALFMWASVKASGESVAATAVVILGILVATGLGWLFYRGALSLNLRVFFQWTGAALILVAAGILAYGIHEFQEVGLLPETVVVYDASAILGKDTIVGSLLYGLFSYRANPTVLEIMVWFAYVVPVMTTFVRGHILARRTSPATA